MLGFKTKMDNLTMLNASFIMELYTGQRIVCFVFNTAMLLIMMYFIAVLSVYEYRVRRQNSAFNCQRSLLVRDKVADLMRRFGFTGCVFTLVRVLTTYPELAHWDLSTATCTGLRKTATALSGVILVSVYLILWLRQRALYRISAISALANKFIQFLSMCVLGLIMTCGGTVLTIHLSSRFFKGTAVGCKLYWTNEALGMAAGLTYMAFLVAFQVILLFLLVYPMCIHQSPTASIKQKHIKLMKRVIATSTVATVVDLFCTLSGALFLTDTYSPLRQVVYNMDHTISIICIVFSFRDWKARLLPFLVRSRTVTGTVRRKFQMNDRPIRSLNQTLATESSSSNS
ncbi:uncharacterized protein LOC100183119 [Ciona intestinalis]